MTATQFRRIALGFAGAVESAHMRHPDFRVGGKIFATLGYPTKAHGAIMLTAREQARLIRMDPAAYAAAAGKWGAGGATVVTLKAADAKTVAAAMKNAWQQRAPKRPPERTHPNSAAFPDGLSGPALRALANAGIRSMKDLAKWSEKDLAALHGMGPKAIRMLKGK